MANSENLDLKRLDEPKSSTNFNHQIYYQNNFDKIDAAIGAPPSTLTTTAKTVVPAINELKSNKVDKVTGKGLSTNDYTTTEKNKLAGIPADTAAQLADKVQNFKIKNEIVNGDFSQGEAGWKSVDSNIISTSGNNLVFIANKLSGNVYVGIPINNIGDIYYAYSEIKATSPEVRLVLTGNITIASKFITGNGEYEKISFLLAIGNDTIWQFSVRDGRSSSFSDISFRKNIVVNLTKIFGAGSEPTKLEMDELIKIIPNNWWDGELLLTQKQYITWQLNLIRKNTNAIIALGGTII